MILTGDLHASPEELRFLDPKYLREKYKDKCENTLIFILGDGGFLWCNDEYSDFNGELIQTLEMRLSELNSKLVVIPGNHENYARIYSLPKEHLKENNLEGDFRRISNNILYTERFGEYSFENKNFLVLGGARSLDKELRHEGEWFPEETFNIEEKDSIISLIKDNEYNYVLSHTCPRYLFGEQIVLSHPCPRYGLILPYIYIRKVATFRWKIATKIMCVEYRLFLNGSLSGSWTMLSISYL